jgi:two-component system sensor histidine kinase AlgZ
MELFYNRYRRVFITLVVALIFWVFGIVCMRYQINFTGLSFTVLSVSGVLYLFLFYFLNRKETAPYSLSITKKEVMLFSLISIFICITGMLESQPDRNDFTTVFGILLIYTLLFIAIQLRNYQLQKKNKAPFSKTFINQLAFWVFVLGFARIIIMIEEYGDSDALIIVAFVYFPVLFFLITRWIFKQTKSILSLKNEKAKTELMHLKSQVNPHFFFNMLNNLYGWVDKDPVKAKKLIISLSEMMRYSIYEGEKDSVSLEDEVVYMQQYIDLHRMRYHKEIDVQFEIDTTEKPVHVMPLLFIILLENAFKHGVENLRENAFVHLKMVANDKQVIFEITNNFDPKEIPATPGIGIQNLKRRLELVYPKKHSLVLDSDNGIYKAKLTLEI